jgi:hypothetical protein
VGMTIYACDYAHYDENWREEPAPAAVWIQDHVGRWTPLCAACLPEFWCGGDQTDGPWVIFPIHVTPPGSLRLNPGRYPAGVPTP